MHDSLKLQTDRCRGTEDDTNALLTHIQTHQQIQSAVSFTKTFWDEVQARLTDEKICLEL